VFIFVKHSNSILRQEIQKVELVPAEETVARFPIHQRFPIIDGWISPRATGGICSTSKMSGTDYREMYLGKMDQFWPPIVKMQISSHVGCIVEPQLMLF
jgi:hypothetical protein